MNTDEDKELCLFSATFRASVVLRVMFFPRNNPGYALSNSSLNAALKAGKIHGAQLKKVRGRSIRSAHVEALRAWADQAHPSEGRPEDA